MKNLFTSHKIALMLKHLGFDEPCFACFETNTEFHVPFIVGFDLETPKHFNQEENCIAVPFYQQVIDWLREEHKIDILILPQDQSACAPLPLYFFAIVFYKTGVCVELYNSSDKLHYCEFGEAREAAILKAINIIKNETN